MRALNRKLLRDAGQMKGQLAAIGLVAASGVAMFVMTLSTLESLAYTRDEYYERYRFAAVFAHLKRAPDALAVRIANLPGVAAAATRIVADVTLEVPGFGEPAAGRLISIPEHQAPPLNGLYLRAGRTIEPRAAGEVIASEAFAAAHGLAPGDSVRAVLNGRRQILRIVGIALSPEYVIQIAAGSLMPDDRRFGVFWMGATALAQAYDLEGAFNDVAVTLRPGTSEAEVIRRLDGLLAPYGGLGGYGREHQLSARYIAEEIRQLRAMGVTVPVIFLGVAAFLLHVVLSRLITTQRQEIAALKAFGYSAREVGGHYLAFAGLTVLVGTVVGTAAGAWLGRDLTHLYTRFYRFPVFHFQLAAPVVVYAAATSAAAAGLGVWSAVAKAMRLPPAQAMRPEPPARYRPALFERLGVRAFLSQPERMIVRHLERQPVKSALSVLGIAMAAAIMVLGSFSRDALDFMMDFQFRRAQRFDVGVAFTDARDGRVCSELRHLPGVLQVEPQRSVPVRLRYGPRHRRLTLMGLPRQASLYRVLDTGGGPVELPPGGVVLERDLARRLGAGLGDTVQVEVLEGARPVRAVPVTGLVAEYSGNNAYMEETALARLLRAEPGVSGAFLQVDPRARDSLYARLRELPAVASVSVQEAVLRSFADTMAENLLRMRVANVLFGGIIAFGVVYNSARISLAERQRELATLRVLGFRRREISGILLGELLILTAVAIPIGLAAGYGLAALTIRLLETELYRIPLVIEPRTYAFAAATVLAGVLFSGLVVRHKLDHLDLIAVLKERE